MEEPNHGYPSPVKMEDTSPLSMGNYLIMMIIFAIPLVGFIMTLVWGFGNTNRNRKNFARASLILLAAGTILGVLLFLVFGAAFIGMATSGVSTVSSALNTVTSPTLDG